MTAPRMKSTTMDYLADRIRGLLDGDPRITEKTMFGGLTFLLNGRILVGCKKDGRILLSVGKNHYEEALARSGATPMLHGGRPMTGFLWVEADAIEDDDDLESWVRTAERWVAQLPPKEPAAPRPKRPKTPATR